MRLGTPANSDFLHVTVSAEVSDEGFDHDHRPLDMRCVS